MDPALVSYTHAPTSNRPASFHDSARASPEILDDFHGLVRDINRILGPFNGIDSAAVDVEELKRLMAKYESKEQDWDRYALAGQSVAERQILLGTGCICINSRDSDHSRAYTRNLVDRGNGKCNLLILVWTPGKGSPIHDHANAHCVMKVLKGSLTETLYGWPCQSSVNPPDCATSPYSIYPSTQHTCSARSDRLEPAALRIQRSTTYERDQVTYMSDRLGLHRVFNPSRDEVAVSLHLYTPPNAAKHGCHIFDESTGKRSHVQQCHFYSELGRRT